MLERVEAAGDGTESIVSWLPHGKAFRVHKPKEFVASVMPQYFRQSKYKSFQRQLHLYGFRRIKSSNMPDFNAYYHEKFLRGQKATSLSMTRKTIKGNTALHSHHLPDPDFYRDGTTTSDSSPVTNSSIATSSNTSTPMGKNTVSRRNSYNSSRKYNDVLLSQQRTSSQALELPASSFRLAEEPLPMGCISSPVTNSSITKRSRTAMLMGKNTVSRRNSYNSNRKYNDVLLNQQRTSLQALTPELLGSSFRPAEEPLPMGCIRSEEVDAMWGFFKENPGFFFGLNEEDEIKSHQYNTDHSIVHDRRHQMELLGLV